MVYMPPIRPTPVQRTIGVTLPDDPGLRATVRQFNEATNFFLRLGFEGRRWSKKVLQEQGYREARGRWPGLQSSLVQGARDSASEMLAREKGKRLPHKRPGSSARYNARTFKAYLETGRLSLCTVEGRRSVPLTVPPYFDPLRKGRVAALRVREDRQGRLRADLIVDLPDPPEVPLPPCPHVLGIDRGIVNVAVASDGRFFHSRDVRRVRGRHRQLRAGLQAIGTRSAKRHLRRLSGRERRFQADVNHRIAKELVASDAPVLALEELHVRKEKRRGRSFNRRLGGWAYGQLLDFVAYKAQERGKRVVLVDPAYTSQDCSQCGARGQRKGSEFACPSCDLRLNADLNAARNIADRGMSLVGRVSSTPRSSRTVSPGEDLRGESSGKPPVSTGGS
jgi:putative transposase